MIETVESIEPNGRFQKNRIWLEGRLVRDFEHFNFLRLVTP
jgi:hypothetical protein